MKNKKLLVALLALGASAQSLAGLTEIELKLQEYVSELTALDAHVVKTPFSVGNDEACDFNTIQKAIDAGADLVRITDIGEAYFENLFISNQSVDLQGNFANCDDANNNVTSDVKAVIDGDDFGSVVLLQKSEGQTQRNKISHLVLQNGKGNSNGGGIMAFDVDLLVMSNVEVKQNSAVSGGGINATNTRLYIDDSVIENNDATADGGGVNSNFMAIIDGQSTVRNNLANNGGGFYGGVLVFSPVEFSGNESTNDGGAFTLNSDQSAIYGKQVCEGGYCFGKNNQAVLIENNFADSDLNQQGHGGGIYLVNSDGNLDVFNAEFIQNKAYIGGAVFTESDIGKTFIDSSHFENNSADYVVIAGVNGTETFNQNSMTIHNSVIVKNGGLGEYLDQYLFSSHDAELNLRYSTIANNQSTSSLIFNEFSAFTVIDSNIFADDNTLYEAGMQATLLIECTLIKNAEGLDQLPALVVGDPEFVDAENGDYSLTANSLAIDFCSQTMPVSYDKNGQERGFDNLSVEDRFGTYDLGAFEFNDDLIFKDNFE